MPETQRSWTIDSIEEGVAAVEEDGGRMIRVPAWLLPSDAREGDVLAVTREEREGAAVLTLRVDRQATERAFARSREQVEGTPPQPHDPGGDIVL